jgi:SAM-dependent methyltransferase
MMAGDARFAQAVETTISTYDRIAATYGERNEEMATFWIEGVSRFLDLLRVTDELALLPGGAVLPEDDLGEFVKMDPVLDAGCGTGRDARALAAEGVPVLAVDLSQGMLDEARERTTRRLPRGAIHYALMDLRRLDLPDACCRGVWCSASLLHVPKHIAPRAMTELARVARPGAPLAIFLKLAGRTPEQHFQPYDETAPTTKRFFAYYMVEEAERLVGAAGFHVRDISRTPDTRREGAPDWIRLLATR